MPFNLGSSPRYVGWRGVGRPLFCPPDRSNEVLTDIRACRAGSEAEFRSKPRSIGRRGRRGGAPLAGPRLGPGATGIRTSARSARPSARSARSGAASLAPSRAVVPPGSRQGRPRPETGPQCEPGSTTNRRGAPQCEPGGTRTARNGPIRPIWCRQPRAKPGGGAASLAPRPPPARNRPAVRAWQHREPARRPAVRAWQHQDRPKRPDPPDLVPPGSRQAGRRCRPPRAKAAPGPEPARSASLAAPRAWQHQDNPKPRSQAPHPDARVGAKPGGPRSARPTDRTRF
jgi:hypothetical protein